MIMKEQDEENNDFKSRLKIIFYEYNSARMYVGNLFWLLSSLSLLKHLNVGGV